MKRKRIFEYDKTKYPQRAYRYALLGLTIPEIAECFGVTLERVHIWIRKYPEFYEAYTQGKEEADSYVADALYKRAIGYTHDDEKIIYDTKEGQVIRVKVTKHYPPDTTAAVTWLKMRQRGKWTETNKVEAKVDVSHHGAVKIQNTDLSDLTDEELELASKLGVKFIEQGEEQSEQANKEWRDKVGIPSDDERSTDDDDTE